MSNPFKGQLAIGKFSVKSNNLPRTEIEMTVAKVFVDANSKTLTLTCDIKGDSSRACKIERHFGTPDSENATLSILATIAPEYASSDNLAAALNGKSFILDRSSGSDKFKAVKSVVTPLAAAFE